MFTYFTTVTRVLSLFCPGQWICLPCHSNVDEYWHVMFRCAQALLRAYSILYILGTGRYQNCCRLELWHSTWCLGVLWLLAASCSSFCLPIALSYLLSANKSMVHISFLLSFFLRPKCNVYNIIILYILCNICIRVPGFRVPFRSKWFASMMHESRIQGLKPNKHSCWEFRKITVCEIYKETQTMTNIGRECEFYLVLNIWYVYLLLCVLFSNEFIIYCLGSKNIIMYSCRAANQFKQDNELKTK